MERDAEIDFLMEMEYRLQSDLTNVQQRLEKLLAPLAEPVRHLVLVREAPDGAA